jgi:hypothetical protein
MKKKLLLLATAAMFSTSLTYAEDVDSKYYLGISGGTSIPLKSKFKIKGKDELTDQDKETDAKLKSSYMTTVSLGYKIAEGSAIEISTDFKPKYDLTIELYDNLGSSKTKAMVNIYTINFVYDFANYGNATPYFIAGLGLADVRVKPTTITSSLLRGAEIFKLNKNHRKALAYQFGLGIHHPITEVVALDVSAKLQAITNVKIKYQEFSMKQGKLVDKSTKQHLGVAELVGGLVFNF